MELQKIFAIVSVQNPVSRDDSKPEEGCDVIWGMGGAGEGAAPLPSLSWAPANSRVRVQENEAGEVAIHYRDHRLAHHPVFAQHAFLLQPENFVQLPRRGPPPVIIG